MVSRRNVLLTWVAEYPSIQLNERMPVLNVGNRENPSYLPAEVCLVLPGQTIKRRLSPDQTSNMITFACRKPYENANSIVGDGKAVLGLNSGQNSVLVSAIVLVCFVNFMLIWDRQNSVSRSERV
jgi:hypothetical protein